MVSIGNCSSTGTITIPVLSVVTVTPAIPYTENFDTQKTLWLVDKTILFGITRTNDPLSNYKFIVDPNDDNYKKTIRENSWKIGTISNTNNNTKGFVTTNAKYTSSSGAGDPIENTYYTNEKLMGILTRIQYFPNQQTHGIFYVLPQFSSKYRRSCFSILNKQRKKTGIM